MRSGKVVRDGEEREALLNRHEREVFRAGGGGSPLCDRWATDGVSGQPDRLRPTTRRRCGRRQGFLGRKDWPRHGRGVFAHERFRRASSSASRGSGARARVRTGTPLPSRQFARAPAALTSSAVSAPNLRRVWERGKHPFMAMPHTHGRGSRDGGRSVFRTFSDTRHAESDG